MEKCFVIQPFDKGKYDERYEDTFKPAIEKAGLEPYRIDKDLSVRIPIEEIEKGIREASMCFAEITTDNPNVWYELGYAFACEKDVVMVCSDERTGKYPFDIQHRQLLSYKTGSMTDYVKLKELITNKITALQKRAKTTSKLVSTPVVDTEGLKSHEIAILIFLMENQTVDEYHTAIHNLKSEMQKAGYTDIATSVGLATLRKKGMISTSMETDEWNNNGDYAACRLTEEGINWIINNQNQLEFRRAEQTESPLPVPSLQTDDLPF